MLDRLVMLKKHKHAVMSWNLLKTKNAYAPNLELTSLDHLICTHFLFDKRPHTEFVTFDLASVYGMYTVVYNTVYDRLRPNTEFVTVDLGIYAITG